MKKALWLFLIFSQIQLFAQSGIGTGVFVSTSFHLNSHRNKQTTLWSFESGYGFAAGIPLRFGYADGRNFITGVNYEYKAFDNWVFNTLQNSTRFHSVQIPLAIQFQLIDNLHLQAGGGFNYNFRSRTFTPGNNIDISNSANPVQPYLSLGINTISERNMGMFDLGFQIKYHILDMWKKSYPIYDVTSSKIMTAELQMRFYL